MTNLEALRKQANEAFDAATGDATNPNSKIIAGIRTNSAPEVVHDDILSRVKNAHARVKQAIRASSLFTASLDRFKA